jgi:hypothetical protein
MPSRFAIELGSGSPKIPDTPKSGDTWPQGADLTYWWTTADFHIGVEIVLGDLLPREPAVVGMIVRRTTRLEPRPLHEDDPEGYLRYRLRRRSSVLPGGLMTPHGGKVDLPLFEGDPRPLTAEDLRGLQLERFRRAALAIARAGSGPAFGSWSDPEGVVRHARRAIMPKGTPQRGSKWYGDFLAKYRQFEQDPTIKSPAAEMARLKSEELDEDVPVGKVYVWKNRALALERREPEGKG